MKKKICMLLVTILTVVTVFFVAPVYAAEKSEDLKISTITPYKNEMGIIPYFYMLRPLESNLSIEKEDENVVVLKINLKEQMISNNVRYISSKEGITAKNFPNIDKAYDNENIPYGAEVQLIAEDNGWALVKKDEKLFFCLSSSLVEEEPPKEEKVEIVEEKVIEKKEEIKKETSNNSNSSQLYSAKDFKRLGVIHWGGWRWTWYSQRVLPGGGLKIPGRHVDSNGYICDKNGYICLASNSLAKGTIVDTPFGKQGKVYDCGCAADTLDVYTDF